MAEDEYVSLRKMGKNLGIHFITFHESLKKRVQNLNLIPGEESFLVHRDFTCTNINLKILNRML